MRKALLQAIEEKKIVKITFNTKEKGVITRLCIPFDIGESRRYKDGKVRYHFYDLNSPEGQHNLSILPEQLQNIEVMDETFKPSDYVTWSPVKWISPRDWGPFS